MTFIRHIKSPQWGPGILAREAYGQRSYLFLDGVTRTFKAELCASLIEPADPPPEPVDAARLLRGRGTESAMPRAVNLELEAEILAARDADDPFLVYADWLQNEGDP